MLLHADSEDSDHTSLRLVILLLFHAQALFVCFFVNDAESTQDGHHLIR